MVSFLIWELGLRWARAGRGLEWSASSRHLLVCGRVGLMGGRKFRWLRCRIVREYISLRFVLLSDCGSAGLEIGYVVKYSLWLVFVLN